MCRRAARDTHWPCPDPGQPGHCEPLQDHVRERSAHGATSGGHRLLACPTLPRLILSLAPLTRRFTSVPFYPVSIMQVKVKVINAATDADESRCPGGCVLPTNTGTVTYLLSGNGANPYTAFVRIAFDGNAVPAAFPIPRAGKWKFQLAGKVREVAYV